MKLSFGARLMFRGMIDHADDDGFFEADPSELKAAIFPADPIDVTDTLRLRDEVVQVGMARLHLVDDEEYIEIPKFQKYQQTRKDLYRPSEIKADIELAKKDESRRYVLVTDPSRTRDTNRLDRVNRIKEQDQELAPKAARKTEKPKTALPAGKRLEAVLAFWSGRFAETITYPQAGMIIKHCRRKGDSPVRFLSSIPADHPTPWKIVAGYLQDTYTWPESVNGQETYSEWATRIGKREGALVST